MRPQLLVNAFESMPALLTLTAPRCPHLGCALKYTEDECSCDHHFHGYHSTEAGKLIDNDATDNIETKCEATFFCSCFTTFSPF